MGQDSASQQPKKPALLTYFFRWDFEPLFLPTFLGPDLIVGDLGVQGAQPSGRRPLRNGGDLAQPELAASMVGRGCEVEGHVWGSGIPLSSQCPFSFLNLIVEGKLRAVCAVLTEPIF